MKLAHLQRYAVLNHALPPLGALRSGAGAGHEGPGFAGAST